MKSVIASALLVLTGCMPHSPAPAPQVELINLTGGNEADWSALKESVLHVSPPFTANVQFVESERMSIDAYLAQLPGDYPYAFLFIADDITFSSPDRPCLVVDLLDETKPRFRATANTLAAIENNLTTANMDFSELEAASKATGQFSGF